MPDAPTTACGSTFGAACFSCNEVDCDEVITAINRACDTCDTRSLTGRAGAAAVVLLGAAPVRAESAAAPRQTTPRHLRARHRLQVIPGGA